MDCVCVCAESLGSSPGKHACLEPSSSCLVSPVLCSQRHTEKVDIQEEKEESEEVGDENENQREEEGGGGEEDIEQEEEEEERRPGCLLTLL